MSHPVGEPAILRYERMAGAWALEPAWVYAIQWGATCRASCMAWSCIGWPIQKPFRAHIGAHEKCQKSCKWHISVSAGVWAQWGQSAAIDHAMRKAYDKIRQLIRDYENIFSDKGVHDQKIGPHKEVFFHEQTISKWKRIGGSWECLQPWSMRIWCNYFVLKI